MAKLQRYTAEPQGAPIAGVRASSPVPTGSIAGGLAQLGQGIERAGELKFQADYNRMKLDDEIQFATATQKFQEAAMFEADVINRMNITDEPLSADDPENYKNLMAFDMSKRDKTVNESLKSFRDKVGQIRYGFKTKDAQAGFESWKIKNAGSFEASIKQAVNAKYDDYQVAKFENLTTDLIKNGQIERANELVGTMAEYGLISQQNANDRRTMNQVMFEQVMAVKNREFISTAVQAGAFKTTSGEIDESAIMQMVEGMTDSKAERTDLLKYAVSEQKMYHQDQKENWQVQIEDDIRGQIEGVLTSGAGLRIDTVLTEDDKRRTYDMISQSVDLAVKSGIYTQGEAAQVKKDLINHVDDVASEFIARRNAEKEKTVIDRFMDIGDKLSKGQFTRDDILLSGLDKEQKDYLNTVLLASREPEPAEFTYEGVNAVSDTVMKFSMGEIGKAEAVQSLIKSRYEDKSIKNYQFKNAFNRINNPYPEYVTDNFRKIMQSAETQLTKQGVGAFFVKDYLDNEEKKQIAYAKNGMMLWLNSYKDNWPSGEEMVKKLAEFSIPLKEKNIQYSQRPREVRPIPNRTDALFVDDEDKRNSLPDGTEYYDAMFGVWRRRVAE